MAILFIGPIVAIIAIILTVVDFKSFESPKDRRKAIDRDWSKRSILSRRLEGELKDKVKISRRYRVERVLKRAGHDTDYWTFLVYRIGFSVAGFFFAFILMQNPILAIVLGVIGFTLPLEIMKIKANARMEKLEGQIGLLMRMVSKRYENSGDMPNALRDTLTDLEGQEPIHEELDRIVSEIDMGLSPVEALENGSDRIGNKFFERFVVFYNIASDAGTDETKRKLLQEAVKQYEDNRALKLEQKKALRDPLFSLWVYLALIPVAFFAGAVSIENFVGFYMHDLIGQIGFAAILLGIIGTIWFMNAKVAAPLDELRRDDEDA